MDEFDDLFKALEGDDRNGRIAQTDSDRIEPKIERPAPEKDAPSGGPSMWNSLGLDGDYTGGPVTPKPRAAKTEPPQRSDPPTDADRRETALDQSWAQASEQVSALPVGFLIITAGPGLGTVYTLFDGLSTIGSGDGQTVQLNHGDTAIDAETRTSVAYDSQSHSFYIGPGPGEALIRKGGKPILATEPLEHGETIAIGKTHLRFVRLCGPDFNWPVPSP